MTDKKIDPQIYQLYDEYCHSSMGRREFLSRAASITVIGGLSGYAMAQALLPNYAGAQEVPQKDDRIVSQDVSYSSPGGTAASIKGLLAHPKGKGPFPAVLVIHENRGLNPHLEDIARRLAAEGFLAFAVDLLSLVGGTPASEDEARELHAKLNQNDAVEALAESVAFLKRHPESTGKVGAVGFCFGGSMVNRLAVASKELDAGVAYYGSQVPAAQVPAIQAALLLHYAGNDARVNAGIEAFEAALKANEKEYTIHIYEGAQHAFNNDTSGARYHKEAAELAWSRTLAFFRERLGNPRGA
jgi:carboxymethylenebutenolidase